MVGAGGHVGSNLLAHLSSRPELQLRGVCRNEVTAAPLRRMGFDVVCCSITDEKAALLALDDCDVVVNCAAASGLPSTARSEDRAVIHALSGLPGRKRLIHLSSVGVYGTCIGATRNTFGEPRPDWSFGRDKLHLERYMWRRLRASSHECVVIRLGHVYGAGTWLSRGVLEMAADSTRRLPFDGESSSNAIHVRNVASALHALVSDWPRSGTYNLVDSPATTWREVFDWNTDAIGATSIPSLDVEQSRQCSTHHRRYAATPLAIRCGSEVRAWARTLPPSLLNSSPTMKAVGVGALAAMRWRALDRRLQAWYAESSGRPPERTLAVAEPWLFSDPAPGPRMCYAGERNGDDKRAVAMWHARYSNPYALLDPPLTPQPSSGQP